MKKFVMIITAILASAMLLSACVTAPVTETSSPSDSSAEFSLTTLTGDTLDQTVFSEHKLIMVNYWATWCGYCVEEIPDLVKISKEYADKGLVIIGVNVDINDTEGAKKFVADQKITYPMINAEGFFLDKIQGYQSIPTTIFFDSTGKQVGEAVVGANNYENWTGLIDLLLDRVE